MSLIKKILLFGIPVILIFNIIFYVNTFVSEKYETQLEGISDDITKVEIEKKKNKIENQRKTIIITSVVLSIVFISLLVIKKKN
jgi:hypothetical protein